MDTSALVAVLLNEPERDGIIATLLDHQPAISAGSVIELLRVVQLTLGTQAMPEVHALLATYDIEIHSVDRNQIKLAEDGMVRYGAGRGAEPAVLNFGDLFSYALAKRLGLPLLFKGKDFWRTDIEPVIVPGLKSAP